MIESGIQALLPLLVIACGVVVLMLQIAYNRQITTSWVITCLTLILAAFAVGKSAALMPIQITPLLLVDQYGLFFTLLIALAALVTALLAKEYLKHRTAEGEEFFLLLLLSSLGGMVMTLATHLASFMLGLELMGVALYALVAYPGRNKSSIEASVKYLILSGAASGTLLFGFALIYAALGTLSFVEIGQKLASQTLDADSQLILLAGTAMVFTGLGFKLSVVPFHMWTPDVYQGAPAPVTGFLATVSKCAVFVAMMRMYLDASLFRYEVLLAGISLLAIASMLVGNLLALQQTNLKRLLAYSSIGHLGYMLITLVVCGVIGGGSFAVEAASYYLVAYVITTLSAFTVIGILSNNSGDSERDDISEVEGLFWRQPLLASILTVAFLSLAGIPLTVGFVGKFYLFTVGVEAKIWGLLSALVVGSGIGVYYYLRVIFSMTKKASEDFAIEQSGRATAVSGGVVLTLLVLMLLLGILPQPLMEYLGAML